MGHCGKGATAQRQWIGQTYWELFHRQANYSHAQHTGSSYEHFDPGFLDRCDYWARNLDWYTRNYTYHWHTINWFGEVGVEVCKSGQHGYGRAFDLTYLTYDDGHWSDMNSSWHLNTLHIRRYIGIVCSIRRYFSTALTAWYNTAHQNHIHFGWDNGSGVPALRTSWKSDTTLIQATANYLNGESIAIDGAWGPITEGAYGRILNALNMNCYNPKSYSSHYKVLLANIMKHAFDNVSLGKYKASC